MAVSGPSHGPSQTPVKTPVVRVSTDPHKQAQANGAAAPATAAVGATSAAKAGAGGNRNLIVGGSVGAGVLAVIVALLVWKPWKSGPPRLNDEPYKIAKFVASADFQSIPFDRQYTFMELLDDKEQAIAKAYDEHKLSDEEYARSLQFAYLGKHLKRAKNFAGKLTPTAQREYLDKQIDKKKKGNGGGATAGAGKPKASSAEPADSEDVKRDDTEEQETISKWPVDAQAQWTAYRAAMKTRKDQRKEEAEKQRAAATQQAAKAATVAPANGAK